MCGLGARGGQELPGVLPAESRACFQNVSKPEECVSYCFGHKVGECLINVMVHDGCDTHMGPLSWEAKATSMAVAAAQEGCCGAREWTRTPRVARSLMGWIGGDQRFDDSMRVGFCLAPL